ncbi:MAG TPA: FliI/YscN family ATPase [Myxococcota bacterium]|nr:FliI/YscN family ATPase [Myxococcota bacterium]
MNLARLAASLEAAPLQRVHGRVVQVVGNLVEARLPGIALGALCRIDERVTAQVVGFREGRALLMPLESVRGIAYGVSVESMDGALSVGLGPDLVGRVLDAMGRPIDLGPPLRPVCRRPIDSDPPDPLQRSVIARPLQTGVRVVDAFLTVGHGQRVAVMAGSGVGKSTLMGMLARNTRSQVNVICLVGERGREVREFIERDLGPEGLARSVVVCVTSDRSPVLQVKGAFTAMTIAEYFRDQGQDVLLLMDSVTRFAMAQRQIGLSAGEPPTRGGFTPSVFALLPRLLERAGPGAGRGSITGVFTVLVDGDDIHDPIGDAVRGILDGHIVLSRKLASHGHYPAVDVLASISRVMPGVVDEEHMAVAGKLRALLATWSENEELVRLGAYRKGTSQEVDEALIKKPIIDILTRQAVGEASPMSDTMTAMKRIAG